MHSRTFDSTLSASPLAAGYRHGGNHPFDGFRDPGGQKRRLLCAAADASVCPIRHAYERNMAREPGSRVTPCARRCA